MPLPTAITTLADARAALVTYTAWLAELHRARVARLRKTFGYQPGIDQIADESLPPQVPVTAGGADPDLPPVAHDGDRRITTFRPVAAGSRPSWHLADPLTVGDNGVRIRQPLQALVGTVTDLDRLQLVIDQCQSLAASCRAAGKDHRAELWQREAAELAAFRDQRERSHITPLAAAWLPEWRQLDTEHALPPPPKPARPPIRPAVLR